MIEHCKFYDHDRTNNTILSGRPLVLIIFMLIFIYLYPDSGFHPDSGLSQGGTDSCLHPDSGLNPDSGF